MPRTIFSTALGRCALAWDEQGNLTRFELPEAVGQANDLAVPPKEIATLVTRVRRHLDGEPQDFSSERYALASVPEFARQVYLAALAVKAGHTATYGELAAAMGQPAAVSRAVGAVLGINPWPLLIPCHRIVAASGKMTGFSAPGGVATKARLLALEGATLL